MEIQVHRLRWENWQPSSVKAIARDPFSEHVAVGRSTGEIEVTYIIK